MNIIFVINSPFPYYAGGIETWLYNISSRLCQSHNVTIVAEAKTFYKEPFFHLNERIKVINYKTLHSYSFFRKILRKQLRMFNNIGKVGKITKILNNLTNTPIVEYYVIALNTLWAATAVNKIRRKKDNVRFICSARGPHAEIASKNCSSLMKHYFNIEKENLINADISLSNGYDTIDYFQKRGIKTSLMKNGIDIKRFLIRYSRPLNEEMPINSINVVSVATLLDIKGIREIIAAIALLIDRSHRDIYLVLVGKGEQEKYKQQAVKLGIKDKVIFLGHRSDVVPYLQHADVITCLSGGAGLSMSALESMASGRPIIAWDTPVYQQFNTTCQTMELVEEKNIESLADGIEHIIDYPNLYKGMIHNACIEAKKYDWEIVNNDLINYLK